MSKTFSTNESDAAFEFSLTVGDLNQTTGVAYLDKFSFKVSSKQDPLLCKFGFLSNQGRVYFENLDKQGFLKTDMELQISLPYLNGTLTQVFCECLDVFGLKRTMYKMVTIQKPTEAQFNVAVNYLTKIQLATQYGVPFRISDVLTLVDLFVSIDKQNLEQI